MPLTLASIRGPLVLLVLCTVPLLLWAQSAPLDTRFIGSFTSLTSVAVLRALAGTVAFALNLVLGARLRLVEALLVVPVEPRRRWSEAQVLALIAALVFAGIMFAAGVGLGDHLARDDSAAEVVTASATTSRETGSSAAGKAVFASAGCGDCHAFDAAGSTAEVGPDLDEGTPDAARVFAIVRDGEGLMPSFEGELTERQIRDVAAFVSTSARR